MVDGDINKMSSCSGGFQPSKKEENRLEASGVDNPGEFKDSRGASAPFS